MYVSIRNLDFYCRVYSTEIIVKREYASAVWTSTAVGGLKNKV